MAQIMNFKRMEVSGVTKEKALAAAPFDIMGEATQAYNLWKEKQTGIISDNDVKQFMLDYLAAKSKNVSGVGFYITLQSAVKDSRKRPYKITNIKRSGSFKPQHVYRWIDKTEGNIVCEVKTNKSDAFKALQKLYADKKYTGKAELIDEYVHKDGKRVLATAEYTPSAGTRHGQYLVFGIEKA